MATNTTTKKHPSRRGRKIKALLIKQGIKQKDLAEELDVTPCVISGVIGEHFESRRVKEHIAFRLGRSYHALWGDAA